MAFAERVRRARRRRCCIEDVSTWATVNPEFSPHRKRWASPRGERLSRPQVATPKHLATRDQRARAGAEKPVLMREGGVRGVDAK